MKLFSAVAAVFALGILLTFHYMDRGIMEFSSTNKIKYIKLNDSTRITINLYSKLKINPTLKKIDLSGEAFFEFSEKGKIYSISSPHGDFITKSSSFNLKSKQDELGATLFVSKGFVKIKPTHNDYQPFIIEAGNQAKILPDIAVVKTPIFDVNYLSWKTGKLNFNNTPLFLVVEKLKELNNSNIEFSNIDNRYCRVTFNLNTISTLDVLKTISQDLNYSIESTGKKILIIGNGCL